MRITIDYDRESYIGLFWRILKGIYLCKKLPSMIRKCSRGYHIVWHGLNISERDMFKYRKIIGDDPNRIRLDMCSEKRIKQVLFTEKITTCYGFIHEYWTKERKELKNCPICGKRVLKSQKVWNKNTKGILIYHTNDNNICKLPIPKW